MAELAALENPSEQLTRESFTAAGELQSEADELLLVVEAWKEGSRYLGEEAGYKLEWNNCRVVYRSPRPYSVWEGSYVLEPNLRRFDVAKWTNSIVSQVMQALFSEDPPVVIVPGPKMTLNSSQAWGVLIGRLLKEAGPNAAASDRMPGLRHGFKEEFNLLVEQWGLCGTGAAVYYVADEEQCIEKREKSEVALPAGASGQGHAVRKLGPPKITRTYETRKRLKFKFIDLGAEDCVVWDPTAAGGDIRLAGWVVARRMVDFYDLQKLALNKDYKIPGAVVDKESEIRDDQVQYTDEKDGSRTLVAGSLIDLFFAPAETDAVPGAPQASQQAQAQRGAIHQAKPSTETPSNPLRKKLELLEYLDQDSGRVISVLNRTRRVRSGHADFGYLSANYWNLPNALLGLGIGQIGANNQQLGQWIVNSALKVLAINLNAPYLAPDSIGQSPRVLRIGAGKVLTVSEQVMAQGGMKLLETAKVDGAIWPVLQESTREGESATGADSLMVQGSSAGPRAGMGRTAGGAARMQGASDTRLEGPMSHLVDQVFLPFIGVIVWFVFHHMSDQEIIDILSEDLGDEFVQALDLDNFHNAKFGYDVLVGAKLGALRNLAQSLVLMFEYGMNPAMQQFLADVHGTTIDVQTIYKLLLLASHCGTGIAKEIVRPLTPEEKARNQKKQEMAAQMGPGGKLAAIDKQAGADSALKEQEADSKMIHDLVLKSVDRAAAVPEAVGGEPKGDFGGG